jgi:hypothetical protein
MRCSSWNTDNQETYPDGGISSGKRCGREAHKWEDYPTGCLMLTASRSKTVWRWCTKIRETQRLWALIAATVLSAYGIKLRGPANTWYRQEERIRGKDTGYWDLALLKCALFYLGSLRVTFSYGQILAAALPSGVQSPGRVEEVTSEN